MAVEHDALAGELAQQGDAGRELVDEEDVVVGGVGGYELGGEVQLAEVGEEYVELAGYGAGEGRDDVLD